MSEQNLRERILNASDIKKETVRVEEWGVDVEVWGLTSAERAQCVEAATVTDAEGNSQVSDTGILIPLMIAGTRDPATKERLFKEADRDALGAKSAAPVERLAKVVLKLSGMSEPEQEKIKGN